MRFKHQGTRFTRAFTLIELLVVIAIIAILAAILFPVFSRARENARRASCMSNLKQLELGFIQYTQDYDEKYPLTTYTNGSSTPGNTWGASVQPYLKSSQIFRCPSDSGTQWNTPSLPPDGTPPYSNSYRINAWMASTNIYGKIASISNTANAIHLAETTDATVGDHFHPFFWGVGTSAGAEVTSGFMNGFTYDNAAHQTRELSLTRHFDGFNVAYADGHVKFVKWSQKWKFNGATPQENQGEFRPQ